MKFDMHCHTKEGSIDAKVDIVTYVKHLKRKGFDGMLVTDHNSYNGYRKWKELNPNQSDGFVVLKGVEYDTRDGGHMIAVLPDGVHCRLLELRGLSIAKLEKIVHQLGGILGPAHPFGTGFFALMNNWWVRRHKEIIKKFDFIETLNGCNYAKANKKAKFLAMHYKKPQFAGSDAHVEQKIGKAFTIFDKKVYCNNDLIRLVREKGQVFTDGSHKDTDKKKENPILKIFGVVGYWFYNKIGAIFYGIARIKEGKQF